MTANFRRVRAFAPVLVVTLAALPAFVLAHPELIGHTWKEEGHPFWLKFETGPHNGDDWRGEWIGKFHVNNHEKGKYHLHMQNATTGKLKMFKEDGTTLLAEGEVHFQGTHHLKFDGHEYRREN